MIALRRVSLEPNISKSVHRFSRSRLKIFSIYSPGGHFVQQSETVWAIFVDNHLRNIPV